MSLFTAQAGKNAGLSQGRREGYEEGRKSMEATKRLARTLENILAESGLERLWANKIVFTINPVHHQDSTLNKKREVFMRMLAYAEYHQRHVKDSIAYLGSVTAAIDKAVSDAKSGKTTEADSLASLAAISQRAKVEAKGISQGQEDKNMIKWIDWRVDNLKKTVRYKIDSNSVIPMVGTLGEQSVTTKTLGAEISENAFGIVDDAKKYLGHDLDIRGMGY